MNTADKDALHAAIMNISCEVPGGNKSDGSPEDKLWLAGFHAGHKIARHASAELVSASPAVEVRMLTLEELADALRPDYGPKVMNRAEAVQYKCAEIWGLTIKEPK
jgi:hypothetical protein